MLEVDRILEGMLGTLEKSVLPAVAGGFARGQLQAVLEVIGSLQGQLRWGGFLLDGEAASLAEVARVAAVALGAEPGAGPHSGEAAAVASRFAEWAAAATNGAGSAGAEGSAGRAGGAGMDRVLEGRALLCALVESGAADHGEVAAAVDSHLANQAILGAMALRPSRLAEISQG